MEHFSRWKQLLYSNGQLGFSIMDNIYGVYLLFFLIPPAELGMPELVDNTPLLLGITLIGLINLFGRVVDAVADPLIAWWSDNAGYRLGRRKFFLITGALPFAASGILLYFQPKAGVSAANGWYTAAMLGLYFFLYTYYMTPYLALIPELSRNASERINLTVFQAVFSLIGAILVLIVSPMIWEGFQAAGMGKTAGFRLTMVVLGVFAFVSMFAAALPVNEKRYSRSKPADVGLFESLALTVKNRRFIIYMIGTILYWFSFNMIRAMIAYYPVVLLNRPSDFQTVLMAALFGVAFLVFFLLPALSRRFTNKQLMLAGMLSFAVLMAITAVVPFLGAAAVPVAVAQMALMGFPVSILLVIPNAAVSDLSELDGFRNGVNREAMFFGTQGLFMKVNYGIALAITASLFSFFGKDAARPLGVILTGPVASVFVLIGFLIFLRYPQEEINRELGEYRAAAQAADGGGGA
jgi:GPH family glycoside/pentoside/hexuronide:cation symporter